MTEAEPRSRRVSDPPPGFVATDATPVEARTIELTTAVALLTARVRLDVPELPLARVRRCLDAALVLAHAVDRLVEALGAEEMAADERAILDAMRDDREPGEDP